MRVASYVVEGKNEARCVFEIGNKRYKWVRTTEILRKRSQNEIQTKKRVAGLHFVLTKATTVDMYVRIATLPGFILL